MKDKIQKKRWTVKNDLEKDLQEFWQNVRNNKSEYKVMLSSWAFSLANYYLTDCEYYSVEGLLSEIPKICQIYEETGSFPKILLVDMFEDDGGRNYAKIFYSFEEQLNRCIDARDHTRVTGDKYLLRRKALLTAFLVYYCITTDYLTIERGLECRIITFFQRTIHENVFQFAQSIRLFCISLNKGTWFQNPMFPYVKMSCEDYDKWKENLITSGKWSLYDVPSVCTCRDVFVANKPGFGAQVLVSRQNDMNNMTVTAYCLSDSILIDYSLNNSIYNLLSSFGLKDVAEKFHDTFHDTFKSKPCQTYMIELISSICVLHSALLDGRFALSSLISHSSVYGFDKRTNVDLSRMMLVEYSSLVDQLCALFEKHIKCPSNKALDKEGAMRQIVEMALERQEIIKIRRAQDVFYTPWTKYEYGNTLLRKFFTICDIPLLCALQSDGYVDIRVAYDEYTDEEYRGMYVQPYNLTTVFLYIPLEPYYCDLADLELWCSENGLAPYGYIRRFVGYLDKSPNFERNDMKNLVDDRVKLIYSSRFRLRYYVPYLKGELEATRRGLFKSFVEAFRRGEA